MKIMTVKRVIQFTQIFAFLFFFNFVKGEDKKVICVGFYNFENYFDTFNDPNTRDDDFTPQGSMGNTWEVFEKKTENLAKVVSEMGAEYTPHGPALLGVAEIENLYVLEHFAKHPLVASRNYTAIHYDSRDSRGIDVALLYNPKYYKPISSSSLLVPLEGDDGKIYYTRDILWATGILDGDTVHVFVNHWPSRRGGEKKSSPKREAAAAVAKHVIDSLNAISTCTKIILMGDLNDDPVNKSVRKVLNASYHKNKTSPGQLYNPFYSFYKSGIGTLAYQDAWNLFDQIMVSQSFICPDTNNNSYTFYKAKIFNPDYLFEQEGRWKGYPKRSFSGGRFNDGYSDHFPTYIILTKKVEVTEE
jgi:endonuclease/exonuclease/phosphatase family metal-dependent hydrolase